MESVTQSSCRGILDSNLSNGTQKSTEKHLLTIHIRPGTLNIDVHCMRSECISTYNSRL